MDHTDDDHAPTAEGYYDSDDADAFYAQVWGGEDIHVGLYDDDHRSVREASRRTVETMAEHLIGLGPDTRVLDLGAGYGGAARLLAREYGCSVVCLNISEVQNARNRERNREHRLDHLIEVVHGRFEDVPADDDSFDVAWSQEAFLHSEARDLVLDEVARVLRPGGQLIFTDPMAADDCPPDVLAPILDRIHLDSLASPSSYRAALEARGFEVVAFHELPHQLRMHYATVRDVLTAKAAAGELDASDEYVARMTAGLGHWVDGADRGHLDWGILHFRKRSEAVT